MSMFIKIPLSGISLQYKKASGRCVPLLFGIFEKFKFDGYWKIVSKDFTNKEIIKTDFLDFRICR